MTIRRRRAFHESALGHACMPHSFLIRMDTTLKRRAELLLVEPPHKPLQCQARLDSWPG
jgi:hypothetical protein